MPHPKPFHRALLVHADIRDQSLAEFLATLRLYGSATRLLERANRYTLLSTLSADMKLDDATQQAICTALARQFRLTWSDIDAAWLRKDDRTIRAIHQRLWRKANVKSGVFIDYTPLE